MHDALGVGLVAIGEEHIFTFMLSSPFTARNLVVQQGDIEGVKTDLKVAVGLGVGFTALMAILLKSGWTALFGVAFGVLLYEVYKARGNL